MPRRGKDRRAVDGRCMRRKRIMMSDDEGEEKTKIRRRRRRRQLKRMNRDVTAEDNRRKK